MNTRLNQNQNWPELAQQANWSIARMAKLCNISARTLERHFLATKGKSPKAWLDEHRELLALDLLRDGVSIKEAAFYLGYKQPTNLSRYLKKRWGCSPTRRITVGIN